MSVFQMTLTNDKQTVFNLAQSYQYNKKIVSNILNPQL